MDSPQVVKIGENVKTFKFKKLDAFTTGISSGNPAGCIYLKSTSDISEAEMQQIARELKGFVNEVIYLFPENGGFFLKFYSSEREVDFCGHGTIAIMFDTIKNDPHLLRQQLITIRVKQDYLAVRNEIAKTNSVYITAPQPRFLDLSISAGEIAKALKIELKEFDGKYNFAMVNAGLSTLIVPIKDLKECLNIAPDLDELKGFCLCHDIDIILVFTTKVASGEYDYRTRVFAPKYGYMEDPATGAGNAALGYYLLNEKVWDGGRLSIEQGPSLEKPNIIRLSTAREGDRTNVIFGGGAIVRMEGIYFLHGR